MSKAILRFFDEMISLYPLDSSEIIGWSTKETQETRFNILNQLASLNYSSVLDVGCGVGDLYGFFKQKLLEVSYTGIDLHPKMVDFARIKYPKGNFKQQELQHCDGYFDYVLVSGAFNLKASDNLRYLSDQLIFMDKISKKGIAFNLLSSYTDLESRYSSLCYYNPADVFKLCKDRFERVIVRHDYLENDFTIYIYK